MSIEATTNVTAVGAFFSPLWLPTFHDVSSAAAGWLPILGVSWLLLQIILKLHDRFRKRGPPRP